MGRANLDYRLRLAPQLVVIVVAAAVYLGCAFSPPSLMDDVDAVQAQIARNMLDSGDWVTARLDGVAYLEKSPLKYWMMAVSYMLFGVHDWAARIPVALFAVLLCWLTARIGAWAFSERAGHVRGPGARHLRRLVSVHPHPDTRYYSDVHHHAGHVVVPARD